MNYEQKYKEALEQAKKELRACGSLDCDAARQVFRLFPELQKSEDERIREDIAEVVKNYGPKNANPKLYSDMLAWLEKQGEQNINDKTGWSEEDEDSVDIAIRIIQNEGDDCAGILDSDRALKWLQSLKQRLNGYR
jgi:hypothetical protein